LSQLPLSAASRPNRPDRPEVEVRFTPPHEGTMARMACVSELACDSITLTPPDAKDWPALRADLRTIRGYVLDHDAMARPAKRDQGDELTASGGNLAAVLARLREIAPEAFSALTEEMLRIMPEFLSLELVEHPDDSVEFGLRLADDGLVRAPELSQGMLYLLGLLALAFDPDPPLILCIEEIDRGIHPRTLREIRDVLYRLTYPKSFGSDRRPVQIVTTTHSPYFIDLFRDHPDEIVIAQKQGSTARFERLADRPDLPELLREGSLGDMWFSGILGGVPEER